MVRILTHTELNDDDISKIVGIKNISWNYSFKEHVRWMEDNLHDNDIHLMLYNINNELIGYSNLVHINVLIDGKKTPFIGVGNVCTNRSKKGIGSALMAQVNKYIHENNHRGLLFCKEPLIVFYEKCNWVIARNVRQENNVISMVYNIDLPPSINIEYIDRSF